MKKFLLIFSLILPSFAFSNENSAIVLMYHRFDQDQHPSTSISSELFRKHLEIIQSKGFKVVSLDYLVELLKEEKVIPDKTVAITVDDAFKSFFERAYPILKEFDYPFSVFVSTDSISNSMNSDYMSWEMLKELSLNRGLILNHTVNHESLIKLNDEEIVFQVSNASKMINSKLGKQPSILSYPYGESSLRVERIIKNLNIEAAFSQHSSPLNNFDSIYRLPRFALNDVYGKIDRFEMILNTLRLPIFEDSYKDIVLYEDEINLKFESNLKVDNINCFINEGAKLNKEDFNDFFSLRISNLKINTRYRLNCTYIKNNKIFWYGKLIKRIN